MKIAYFDCPSGASGDMILGALIDAGVSLAAVEDALHGLGVGGWRLVARSVERRGIRGTQLVVETDPTVHFPDLQALVEPVARSTLPDALRARATGVLHRLAEAEARVHGVAPGAAHFHEVGALDTLVDVVGAVAGLAALGIEEVRVSPLPLGGGTVNTAHGPLPVPAPAVVELLRGFAVRDSGVQAEVLTPTGAAILTTLATPGRLPPMRLERVGWGAGMRELAVPNLLRVLVGEAGGPAGIERETLAVIETTIDDMSPQLYEPLMERVLEAGALDVHLTPVIMKRSRPGVVVTAFAAPERVADLATLLFRETTTLGVRWQEWERARLSRELVRVQTSVGPVTFKLSRLGGRTVRATPEFEEVRRIARERRVPVAELLEEVRAEGRRLLGGSGSGRAPEA